MGTGFQFGKVKRVLEMDGGYSCTKMWMYLICECTVSFKMVVVVVQYCHVWLFVTPWTAAHQAFLSSTISRGLLKWMPIESVMLSNHLIFCYPRLLLSSVFPIINVSSNKSALSIRWPKYWSFCVSPFKEYSGLISFGIDWFDLLYIKSLLQDHNSRWLQ